MGLEEYQRKRDFAQTPEPAGRVRSEAGHSFVIQKHRASRLHYDLRLEMEGVLRSWAVPKGPSLDPREKRLAVLTEDHPVDYGGFEGVIPKGHYGAGSVIVWDQGTYLMVDPPTAEQGWRKRKFHVVLHGRKLGGEWVLVETRRDERHWLFFKVDDSFASDEDIIKTRPESILSGLRVEEVTSSTATRHWHAEIERTLEVHGLKEQSKSSMPRGVSPMLATLRDAAFDNDRWLFELKLDGIRAIAYKQGPALEMQSRNRKPLAKRFPAVTAALKSLPADSAIIDGEIVALDKDGRSRFSLLQPRIHLSQAEEIARAEQSVPVLFYAFDLLFVNGYDLRAQPLEDRKAVLRKLVPTENVIRYTDHIVGTGRDFFEAAVAHRLEGVVAKRRDSPYVEGRSTQWLKIKTARTADFVVAGFTPPEGARKHLGALVLGLHDSEGHLTYVGRAGSGFDDRGLRNAYAMLESQTMEQAPFRPVPRELARARWVRPDRVCEIRFSEWTPDRKLRAPVFIRFRDDIDPAECTLPDFDLPDPATAEAGIQDDPSADGQTALTNLSKTFWPEDGLTKGDLIHYYREIADYLNPHLEQRPLVMKRYPDGIHGDYFYQKDAPDYTPEWMRTETLWSEDAQRWIRYFIGGDSEGLVYLANMGGITQNPWHSRLGRLDSPDYVVFDLDPGPGVDFQVVRRVALELQKVLEELELRTYPKTSGATGIHVYLPLLVDSFSYADVRIVAQAIASIVVARAPELATIERVVRRRPKAVYIDFLQNIKGKTVASVYSPRARVGAPVSTPLRWSELRRRFEPGRYHVKNIFRRLARVGDLFEGVLTDRQDIRPFLDALESRKM